MMNEAKETEQFIAEYGDQPDQWPENDEWGLLHEGWLGRAKLDRTDEARRIIAHFVGFVGLTFKAQRPGLMAKAEAFLAGQEKS